MTPQNTPEATKRSDGIDWLERLGKWRSVFTGWMLGTRPPGDPEADAVRDLTDFRLAIRAEVSALIQLSIDRGLFTEAEFNAEVQACAKILNQRLEEKFPGFKATDKGIHVDTKLSVETTRTWKP